MKGENGVRPAAGMEEKKRKQGRNQGINELFGV